MGGRAILPNQSSTNIIDASSTYSVRSGSLISQGTAETGLTVIAHPMAAA
jgi:hypothetical protein